MMKTLKGARTPTRHTTCKLVNYFIFPLITTLGVAKARSYSFRRNLTTVSFSSDSHATR